MSIFDRCEKWNQRLIGQILQILATRELYGDDMEAKVGYSIRIILVELEKLLALIVVAVLFRHFLEFLFAYVVLAVLRSFMGGTHRKTTLGCLFYSGCSFAVILTLSEAVVVPWGLELLVYVCGFLLIAFTAPLPSQNRIHYNKKQRLRLKCFACITLIVWMLIRQLVEFPYDEVMIWAIAYQLFDVGIALIHRRYNA